MSTVIRMGAAHWDITVQTEGGPLHFDFRRMSRDERRQFHAAFMGAYRTVNPFRPKGRGRAPSKRRSKRAA